MQPTASSKSLTRTPSMYGRTSSFSNMNTTMQSFRKMKMHTRMDEPGPGDYAVAGMPLPKGGRFNMSNPKSKVEWEIYRAKQLPGPADYGTPQLPGPGGGRFSTANPKTELDWVVYRTKQLPGPADYGAPRLPRPEGGRFSSANPKTEIEWLQYFAAQVPGPGDYNPKTKKLSTQRSAPSFPIYGKMVYGNHQTGLKDAICYAHTTINQQGPNQCRSVGALGKQVDSLKRSKPSFSFGRSGDRPAVLNRRDVQRALGAKTRRGDSDQYAKFFGYTPTRSKSHTAKLRSRKAKPRRRPATSAERPRRTRGGEDDNMWAREAGAGAGGGEGAGAGADGFGMSPERGGEASSRAKTATKKKKTRKKKRRVKRRTRKRGPRLDYEMNAAVHAQGRPVFSGDRSIPGVGAYSPSTSTMGPVFDSKYRSGPSFSFSAVD